MNINDYLSFHEVFILYSERLKLKYKYIYIYINIYRLSIFLERGGGRGESLYSLVIIL